MSNDTEQPSPPHEETPLLDPEDDSSVEKKAKPKLPVAYIFFRVHTIATVISLALISIAQYLPPSHHRPLFFTYLIHLYMVLISAIGKCIELDWAKWFIDKFVPMLKNWIIRGFFYVFIALFAIEESTFAHFTPKKRIGVPPPPATEAVVTKKFFHTLGAKISSMILWVGGIGLLATGTLYIFMGLLFLDKLKKNSEEEYERRKNDALDAEGGDEEE